MLVGFKFCWNHNFGQIWARKVLREEILRRRGQNPIEPLDLPHFVDRRACYDDTGSVSSLLFYFVEFCWNCGYEWILLAR